MPATNAAAVFSNIAAAPKAPDRERELWMAVPKGGKTLGGSDRAFLENAGFSAEGVQSRIDDYQLVDGPEFKDVGLRAWIKRPKDALYDILDGMMDVAIVGRDVLKEVNSSLPAGTPKLKEILDLGMASCVLTLAVREGDNISCLDAFNNAVIGSKYEDTTREWLAKQNITPSKILYRDGGMESLMRQSNGITAISDIVESGKSLVENGLIPFGMTAEAWAPVKNGEVRFADLPTAQLAKIPGVITISRAALVRAPQTLSPKKEKGIAVLAERFFNAATNSGYQAKLKMKLPVAATRGPAAVASFPGHLGARW